ncbi:MAG: response regulator, partial [Acidimicrobiia bacterium]|nr:response regulator [Acidimicrobiia bacterium]
MADRLAGGPVANRVTPKPAAATILVVDDEPMVREVVARYLQAENYRVVEQSDGAEARRWLERHRPDLVVLDV